MVRDDCGTRPVFAPGDDDEPENHDRGVDPQWYNLAANGPNACTGNATSIRSYRRLSQVLVHRSG